MVDWPRTGPMQARNRSVRLPRTMRREEDTGLHMGKPSRSCIPISVADQGKCDCYSQNVEALSYWITAESRGHCSKRSEDRYNTSTSIGSSFHCTSMVHRYSQGLHLYIRWLGRDSREALFSIKGIWTLDGEGFRRPKPP
jgi:hypothetical protein